MLNSCKNAIRTQDGIIIGEQQFIVDPTILAKFTKLNLLFSPDFVFKSDDFKQVHDFMSYAVAQDLFAILSAQQTYLAAYSATKIVNIQKLASFLGLDDTTVLERNIF